MRATAWAFEPRMLLQVIHETRYDYAGPVKTAQHMAHLRPIDRPTQHLLRHELDIRPAPEQRSETIDVYGNHRTFFSLRSAHDALDVVARSLVETVTPAPVQCEIAWEAVRERLRYHRAASWDPAAEFVFASPHVPRHPDFRAYAQPSFATGRPFQEAASDLMRRIHADFEFEPCATDVGTPALQALALRKGVCQDFAHIMLGCLRSMDLPGRYVSGYLLTQPPPGQPRLVGTDASHAWISVYLPSVAGNSDWLDLDPTNGRLAGADYVTLAIGRDYSDVSPLRGVIHGGERHQLHVAVTVTPIASPTISAASPNQGNP
jgi:transglutaminase-like putative cysteine protease